MGTMFGPGSLGVPFPPRRRYHEEYPMEGKGPKGWENTILRMKQHGINNPWRLSNWMHKQGMRPHPQRLQEACTLVAALQAVAATESRGCRALLQDAVTGDVSAQLQVTAACRILALVRNRVAGD